MPIARGILFATALLTLGTHTADAQTKEAAMKIKFTLNGTVVTATLDDNATARDFIAMLPLTVTLEDLAATEKIAYLPAKLSTRGAPSGIDPNAGDVAYYAPWGNLALFHKDFRLSPGLVRIGRIDQGIEALRITAPVRRYLPKLTDLVWSRQINPGKVFDLTLPLEQVAEGYRAMDERRAIKALLRP